MTERWILGIGILIGFLWIRSRASALRNEEGGSRKALYGIFFFLAPLLFVGKQVFGRLPFQHTTNFIIEILSITVLFVLTGVFFLRRPKN